MNGKIINTLNIILRTAGCKWARKSGCSMCGYINSSTYNVTKDNLINQFEKAYSKYKKDRSFCVKIFNSGSFFDEKEVPEEVIKYIVKKIKDDARVELLSVESRPEYIRKSKIEKITDTLSNFEVGIGLETVNNNIREECINKNFSYNDFLDGVKKINTLGGNVKSYLLLKPPFLTEKESLIDGISSIKALNKLDISKISINPCNVQKGTIVNEMFKSNEYRPPWLWSLVEILKKAHKSKSDIDVISDPVGGGKKRGIHNCGNCDKDVLNAIKYYSLNQDISVLEGLNCECKNTWTKILEKEDDTHQLLGTTYLE